MIPARGNYEAHYKKQTKHHPSSSSTDLSVEAWDDEGNPLVVSRRGLVRADSIEGFVGVDHVENEPIVAAVPGGGWKVRTTGKKRDWEEPVLAWIVEPSGWARPITPWGDGPGDIHAAVPFGGDYVLIPPDGVVRPGQEVDSDAEDRDDADGKTSG